MLAQLKNDNVEKQQVKTNGLKRKIDFVSKRETTRWCKEAPHILPGSESDVDVKSATNFKSEKK